MKYKVFDEHRILHKLEHYLPSQNVLKDFIHHNTLHAFQEHNFFTALQMGQELFGYRTTLSLNEYKKRYENGEIRRHIIKRIIQEDPTDLIPLHDRFNAMMQSSIVEPYQEEKVGSLRRKWLRLIKFDLDTVVSHSLFKFIGSYLDQGISSIEFRAASKGFLDSIRAIQQSSYLKIFHSKRVVSLLLSEDTTMSDLLDIIVGDERYYEQYLLDQQMVHPGWSGMVSVLGKNESMLFDQRKISLRDFIIFELLLEIEALDSKLKSWGQVCRIVNNPTTYSFEAPVLTKEWLIRKWWQESLEMSYFDQVLCGIKANHNLVTLDRKVPKFQAYFCIDDREESLRRWIEYFEPEGETKGSPAHFNLLIKYRPKGGKFNAHVCPAPAQPKHIITDESDTISTRRDLHYHQSSNSMFSGWIISQTLGLLAVVKLFINLFKPSISPGHSSSFEHMTHKATPKYENSDGERLGEFQLGFTVEEMVQVIGTELIRTGSLSHFAPIVYFFGHGGSSTNNPYYAGYNCGACSGKPSSLNARLFATMANRSDVREGLKDMGIDIPDTTQFVGGLHDTTRDEIVCYDTDLLSSANATLHKSLMLSFDKALANNAKERARFFGGIDTALKAETIHKKVKLRSYSLFEPRPELNHTNNCLCIVGRRDLSKNLYMDQRAFLNSYDYTIDPDGKYLTGILSAATPVCGGINLEYYFSRVDNERFGSGSKLPHNVVGLFGVSNGIEGDLRTGLPSQMIDMHVPSRLMMIIEQRLSVVKSVLEHNRGIKAWYDQDWLKMVVACPDSGQLHIYNNGQFKVYQPLSDELIALNNQEEVASVREGILPVYKLV